MINFNFSLPKEYIFPETFKESADSYIAYREKIGIIPKSIQISRLYLFRFFSFLETKDIRSIESVSVKVCDINLNDTVLQSFLRRLRK